jgi:hypothetical protein
MTDTPPTPHLCPTCGKCCKFSPAVIARARALVAGGMSLRKTAAVLTDEGERQISPALVHQWCMGAERKVEKVRRERRARARKRPNGWWY